jgi:hypothetical protein
MEKKVVAEPGVQAVAHGKLAPVVAAAPRDNIRFQGCLGVGEAPTSIEEVVGDRRWGGVRRQCLSRGRQVDGAGGAELPLRDRSEESGCEVRSRQRGEANREKYHREEESQSRVRRPNSVCFG